MYGYRKGLPNEYLMELDAGSQDGQSVSGTSYEWALQSFFGRMNYNYKGKYLAEVNFRYDGSSRFHKDNRWGVFPSFSAGWRVSEEEFAKNIDWLTNLKIRGSWGKLGNQEIGNYPYQSVLRLGYDYPFGAMESGARQSALVNENITWETTEITDIGFDLDLGNGLFSLTFDYFEKTTSDILRGAQVMGHVGLTAPTINGGEMKNTGFDLAASHRKKVGDFSYGINFTISKVKNELTKYGAQEIHGQTIRKEGIPWDSWYLYEFDGIFQSEQDIANSPTHFYTPTPGDIKLKDQNGDKKITPDDRKVFDGKYPELSYGASINLQWKNFDFMALFQGVTGASNYVSMWGTEPFIQGSRPPVSWRDAWSPTNPTNEMPKLYFGFSDTNNRHASSYWLQNSSYLRLKNIQLGYNVPKRLLRGGSIKYLRFYVSGDNILTFTKYEGADPERDQPGWRNFAVYPQLKIYSAGIKVKF
jgi:TonB-linked SusC/RagA family outer membrane protein